MIKKSLCVFICLFVTYTLITNVFKISTVPQHQWQDNIIKAEKYIYNPTDTFQQVIVGSSLSARLVMDSLPHCYNLSFGGQDIFDGLRLLEQRQRLPKTVFIETNIVLHEPNPTFAEGLLSPIPFYSKKYFNSLQSDKQPLTLFYPLLLRIKAARKRPASAPTQDTALFNKMLQMQTHNYDSVPNPALVRRQFSLLSHLVLDLEKRGVKIVFFEMPVHPNLVDLPFSNAVRNGFYTYFPEKQYAYIKPPADFKPMTTDGVHLNPTEAQVYTHFFKNNSYFLN